ncbi:histidine kinase [Sphingobacterium corticibacter]|uniref:histidine kinase n=2 Tax=Sphingobacterium corticibacter TaxID=2171749 RepID=A0A2T8HJ73_9SPHI|nr:histidine kinase [Sphingobacterium corticibacter]
MKCLQLSYRSIFLAVIILFIVGYSRAQAAGDSIIVLQIGGGDRYVINDHLHWFRTSEILDPDSVFSLFSGMGGKSLAPSSGIHSTFGNDHYWLSLKLQNSGSDNRTIYFQLNNPHLDSVRVFYQTPDGMKQLWETGATLPFDTRPYPYHDFVLPLKLTAGATEYFIIHTKKEGKIFSIKPELMDEDYFKGKEQRLYTIFGLFLGFMLFNVFVNLFLGVTLGDRIHYLYSLYVLAAMSWMFCSVGAEFQFVFPNHPEWFMLSQSITGAITMILMSLLAFVFLQLKDLRIKAKFVLQCATGLLLITLPVKLAVESFFPSFSHLKEFLLYSYLLSVAGIAVGIVWVAIVRIRQGFTPAWFYLSAMCYLTISILFACYRILRYGDLTELFSTPTNVQLGLLVETTIIFLGIIYRYNLMKGERIHLKQQLAKQELDMNRQVIVAQEDERRRLAQDLHDDVGATLSTLILHISNVPELPEWQTDFALNYNRKSLSIGKKALADLRNIAHDLLPRDLQVNGLFGTLNERLQSLRSITSLHLDLYTHGDDRAIGEELVLTLYRVVNELLNNVIKHAEATRASIDISFIGDEIILVVEDNGKGIKVDHRHLGMGIRNIESRVAFWGGTVNMDSNARGTTVIITIPNVQKA